jgi:hypothetical protein
MADRKVALRDSKLVDKSNQPLLNSEGTIKYNPGNKLTDKHNQTLIDENGTFKLNETNTIVDKNDNVLVDEDGLGLIQFISGPNVVKISSQESFDYYFGSRWRVDGGSEWYSSSNSYYSQTVDGVVIPENTTIILSPIGGNVAGNLDPTSEEYPDGYGDAGTNVYNGKPAYVLKNKIYLSKNVVIQGYNDNDVIIIKNDADNTNETNIGFYTSYMYTSISTTQSSDEFRGVMDYTNYNPGDTIYWASDSTYYIVIETKSDNGGTVVVDRSISGPTSTGIYSLVDGIQLKGWCIDGRGNVNGLGGSVGTSTGIGCFDLSYCGVSEINCKIINSLTNNGGAVYSNNTAYRLEIMDIESCRAINNGGGVYGCNYSKIIISECEADVAG